MGMAFEVGEGGRRVAGFPTGHQASSLAAFETASARLDRTEPEKQSVIFTVEHEEVATRWIVIGIRGW